MNPLVVNFIQVKRIKNKNKTLKLRNTIQLKTNWKSFYHIRDKLTVIINQNLK
jgi:hypothetical protein